MENQRMCSIAVDTGAGWQTLRHDGRVMVFVDDASARDFLSVADPRGQSRVRFGAIMGDERIMHMMPRRHPTIGGGR